MVVRCPNGHDNPDHQAYCGQCGAPVTAPSQSAHQAITAQQPGWYDDPNDPNAQRYWDGQQWTPQRRRKSTPPQSPAPMTATPPPPLSFGASMSPPAPPPPGTPGSTSSTPVARRRLPRWAWIAAAIIAAVVVVAGGIAWGKNRAAENAAKAVAAVRWSGFPHTMGCVVDPQGQELPGPPDPYTRLAQLPAATRVKQVALTHLSGEQLQLSIEFPGTPPAVPDVVTDPGNGGHLTDAPGSISYSFLVESSNDQAEDVDLDSPSVGKPWVADTSTLDPPNRAVLVSTRTEGNVVTIALDLAGQAKFMGVNAFRPNLDFVFVGTGPLSPVVISGVRLTDTYPMLMFNGLTCSWDTPVSSQSPPGSGGTPPASPPRPQIPWGQVFPSAPAPDPPIPGQQIPATQGPPPPVAERAGCGPDEATALQSALAQVPAPQIAATTGARWSAQIWAPNSNYDPCADLSAVLITVEGATGSSPEQALMFHRGSYLGTGTLKDYAFVSLDKAASTKDTVVLSYRSGQSCTACGDGVVNTVRYHWDGTRVQMLDPPPPG
jgi:LppP/LprE lipoprotein/Protein of unknown function (DUF2510)